jgi:hypothetical protein
METWSSAFFSERERYRRTRDELSQRIERWLVDRPERG